MPQKIYPDFTRQGFDIRGTRRLALAGDLNRQRPGGLVRDGGGAGSDVDDPTDPPPDDGQGSGCKRVYVANVYEDESGGIYAVVFENTIGPIVWSKISTGIFRGTLAGELPDGNTWLVIDKDTLLIDPDSGVTTDVTFKHPAGQSDYVEIKTTDLLGPGFVDGRLAGTSIEIRTYCSDTCIDITMGDTILPSGFVGEPYYFAVPLTGTPPFVLSDVTGPGWLTISIIGTSLVFSGTPDAADTVLVGGQITNCAEGLVEMGTSITVIEPTEDMILYNSERPVSGSISLWVTFNSIGQTGTVDWGDGSGAIPFDTGLANNTTLNHTYAAGDFLAIIICDDPAEFRWLRDDQSGAGYVSNVRVGLSYTTLELLHLTNGVLTGTPTAVPETLYLTNMPNIVGAFDLSGYGTANILLTNLSAMTELSGFNSILNQLLVSQCDAMTDISALPSNIVSLNVSLCDGFTTFANTTLPSSVLFLSLTGLPLWNQLLTLPSGLLQCAYQNLDSLLDASVPTLPTGLLTFQFSSNPGITNVLVIPSTVTTVGLVNNISLDFVTISSLPDCIEFRANGSSFDSSYVNYMLSFLAANGQINGTATFQGQTAPAPPTGAGITDKATLISNGWTVTTD